MKTSKEFKKELLMRLRLWLQDWIKRHKYTQAEAASILGTTDTTINLFLAGKRSLSDNMVLQFIEKSGENLKIFGDDYNPIKDGAKQSIEEEARLRGLSLEHLQQEVEAEERRESFSIVGSKHSNIASVRGLDETDLEDCDFLQVEFRDDMRLYAGGGGAIEGTYDLSSSPIVVHKASLALRSPNPKRLIAFKVGGDSMEPTIAKGGIVIVDRTHDRIEHIHDRDIYAFLCLSDGEAWIKRLSRSQKTGKIVIESDNINEHAMDDEPDNIRLIGRVVWSWREH